MATEITKQAAIEQLVEFIRKDADVDAIARIWTDWIGDDITRVREDESTVSQSYLNGHRVPKSMPLCCADFKNYVQYGTPLPAGHDDVCTDACINGTCFQCGVVLNNLNPGFGLYRGKTYCEPCLLIMGVPPDKVAKARSI